MFYYLKGKITALEPYLAVVDCAGIGFACNTSMRTISALKQGQEATLYTYCNIREDAFDIYGFISPAEIRCFRLLVGVSGVGPKAALSILSANAPEDLAMAIAFGNEKALTLAPGVGKKLAQRKIQWRRRCTRRSWIQSGRNRLRASKGGYFVPFRGRGDS